MTRTSKLSKRLSGNLREDRMRHTGGLAALRRLPVAPVTLSKEAKEAWKECGKRAIALGVLTEHDVPLLELLARTMGSCSELEATLRRDGQIIESANGVRKAHPGLQALDRSRALCHKLLGELGLTPSSRERISFEPDFADNPFNQFVDNKVRRLKTPEEEAEDRKRLRDMMRRQES